MGLTLSELQARNAAFRKKQEEEAKRLAAESEPVAEQPAEKPAKKPSKRKYLVVDDEAPKEEEEPKGEDSKPEGE